MEGAGVYFATVQVSAAPPHLNPGRAPTAAYALVLPVAAGAALASVGVRWLVARAAEWAGGDIEHPVWAHPALLVFAIALLGLVAGRALGGLARQADPAGNDVSWALTGADRSPWRRASVRRILGTLVASVGLAPIGREVAVLELGALVGDTTVRGRQGSRRLAAAGVAAAFTAAYHAPLAATVFVVEHLVWSRYSAPERHRAAARLAPWAAAGAVIGHVTALVILGDQPLLPAPGSIGPASFTAALVLAVPAAVVAATFAPLRARLSGWARAGSGRRPAVLMIATATAIAAFPLVSGNGLEALRTAGTDLTLATAAMIVVGRLLATSAAIAAGVPGGVFSPSLAVAGGTAAIVLVAADRLGLDLGVRRWDVVVIVSVVGVAVSLRSPFVAALVIPEMTGRMSLIPVCAAVVAVAWVVTTAAEVRRDARCSGRCGRRVR